MEAEYAKMAEQYGMEVENLKKYIEAEVVKEQVARSKAIAVVVDSAVAVKPEEKKEEAPAEETAAEETPAESAE